MRGIDSREGDGGRGYRDLLGGFPPVQEGKTCSSQRFSAFAISLQGGSHRQKEPPVPCQDYSDVRIMEEYGVVVGGIADGLGSCKLSHWGSYIAVTEALDYVEDRFRELPGLTKERMEAVLDGAFDHAIRMVEQAADEGMVAVGNLESTLTVAVYDGSSLYCCHVGDDGVVAQDKDGNVWMVTKRFKGEEANSVYPLQTGKREFTTAEQVAGFVMATDGVLDSFVKRGQVPGVENYFNGVFYPFIRSAFYELKREQEEAVLQAYKDMLRSAEYQRKVTDDMTLVAAAAPGAIRAAKTPDFDKNRWTAMEKEASQVQREGLYGMKVPREAEREEPGRWEREKKEGTGEPKQGFEYSRRDRRIFFSGIIAAIAVMALLVSVALIAMGIWRVANPTAAEKDISEGDVVHDGVFIREERPEPKECSFTFHNGTESVTVWDGNLRPVGELANGNLVSLIGTARIDWESFPDLIGADENHVTFRKVDDSMILVLRGSEFSEKLSGVFHSKGEGKDFSHEWHYVEFAHGEETLSGYINRDKIKNISSVSD